MWKFKQFVKRLFQLRTYRFIWEILTVGWTTSETWSLDCTHAEFILPRLKELKNQMNERVVPSTLTNEEWMELLNTMIYSFEYASNQFNIEGGVNHDKVKLGLENFSKYYFALWW